MTHILTGIAGLGVLCLLFAIPYVIGAALGNASGEDLNAHGKLLIGLMVTLIVSIVLTCAYILGDAVINFWSK